MGTSVRACLDSGYFQWVEERCFLAEGAGFQSMTETAMSWPAPLPALSVLSPRGWVVPRKPYQIEDRNSSPGVVCLAVFWKDEH